MKSITLIFLSIITLGFISCRESALSDVEIDDPSLLKSYATVWKYCNLDSTVKEVESISLRLMDKTDHSVDLLKGAVYCNGIEMMDQHNLLGPYYGVPSNQVEIKADTTYTFIVELADESQYTGSVYVDEGYLNSLNAPSNWTWEEDGSLTVTWNEVNNNYTTTLSWIISFNPGVDDTGIPSIGNENVSGQTSYSFPASFFTNGSDVVVIDKFTIYLTSIKEGIMDNRFRTGSTKCKFEYFKEVDVL